MHIPDLSLTTYNNHGSGEFEYRSVGWLGNKVTSKGESSPKLIGQLSELKEQNQIFEGDLGSHTCEICRRFDDRGEFYVEAAGIRYVLPNMVTHYIAAHKYCLPDAVVIAIQKFCSSGSMKS